MGVGLPFLTSLLSACGETDVLFPRITSRFSGKVLIVGAGAAGLSAGYLLKRLGVDFQIIEAAPVVGGRLKQADDFADFPIDLGAEWIHTDPKVLDEIIGKPGGAAGVETIVYNPQTLQNWNNGKLKTHNYVRHFYSEWKFKSSTWFGFFEQFIVPEIAEHIQLNTPVTAINYAGDRVVVTSNKDEVFEADKVLLTVSVKLLQEEQIRFSPPLGRAKKEAIDSVFMGDGIKVFVEFKERFYPDMLAFGNFFKAFNAEEKFVYDAAYGKDSSRYILGLFAINEPARVYAQLGDDDAIIAHFLAELDAIFNGQASANYVKHVVQNWSREPFIQGAYSYSFDGNQEKLVAAIGAPVDGKIYFAGEALSVENQAMVHGACESAYATVAKMVAEA